MDPLLTTIITAIDKGGVYGIAVVFAVMWWLGRQDLKQEREIAREADRRATDGLNNAANAIGDLRVYMGLNRQDRRSAE